jgi:Cu+-exporting ATPase
MTCTGCEGEIEHELRKVPGVVDANVNFERKRADVQVATPSTKPALLVAAVEKAGYHASVMRPRTGR